MESKLNVEEINGGNLSNLVSEELSVVPVDERRRCLCSGVPCYQLGADVGLGTGRGPLFEILPVNGESVSPERSLTTAGSAPQAVHRRQRTVHWRQRTADSAPQAVHRRQRTAGSAQQAAHCTVHWRWPSCFCRILRSTLPIVGSDQDWGVIIMCSQGCDKYSRVRTG